MTMDKHLSRQDDNFLPPVHVNPFVQLCVLFRIGGALMLHHFHQCTFHLLKKATLMYYAELWNWILLTSFSPSLTKSQPNRID